MSPSLSFWVDLKASAVRSGEPAKVRLRNVVDLLWLKSGGDDDGDGTRHGRCEVQRDVAQGGVDVAGVE